MASGRIKNGSISLPPVMTRNVAIKAKRLPDSVVKDSANKTRMKTTEMTKQTETPRRQRFLNVAVLLKRLPDSTLKKYVGKFNENDDFLKFKKRSQGNGRKTIATKYNGRKPISTKQPSIKQTTRKNREKSVAENQRFTCSLAKVSSLNWEDKNSDGCPRVYNLGTPVVLIKKLLDSQGSSIAKDALCTGQENSITDSQNMTKELPGFVGSETELSRIGQTNGIANNQEILEKFDLQARGGSRKMPIAF